MEIRELLIVERNVFITISVILLLIYAVTRALLPKVFGTNFDPSKLFIFRVREEIGYSLKPFSPGQLFLSGVYALTISFLILFLGKNLVFEGSEISSLFDFQNFLNGILTWLLISVGVYLLIFLKFTFLFLFSWLFNLGSGYQRQFIDFFSTSSIFFLLVSLLLSATLYGQFISSEFLASLLLKMAIVFLFYRTILIYIKLLQTTEYSKLYIFSYICTTELIPLFIGIKYLVR